MTTGNHTYETLSDADKQAFIRYTVDSVAHLWGLYAHPANQIAEWEKEILEIGEEAKQTDARLALVLTSSDEDWQEAPTEDEVEISAEEQQTIDDTRQQLTEEAASLKRISNALLAWGAPGPDGQAPTKLRHLLRTISSSALSDSNEMFEALRNDPDTDYQEEASKSLIVAELKLSYSEAKAAIATLEFKLANEGPKITLFVDALRDVVGVDALAADVAENRPFLVAEDEEDEEEVWG